MKCWASCSGFPAIRHDPCESQDVDRARTGPQQRARGGIDGRARGQHVVDEQDAPGFDEASRGRGHVKSTLQVVCALGARQPDLLTGAPDANRFDVSSPHSVTTG